MDNKLEKVIFHKLTKKRKHSWMKLKLLKKMKEKRNNRKNNT